MNKTIDLKNINKIYPNGIQAVFDFNLTIKEQDFVVFVGPSGCGKTTTLRMIAGLEDISYGELIFDGNTMNSVEPKNRNVAMVFQNYALYPHMSVWENIAFSLKTRKEDKQKINQKVAWAAKILNLENYLNRKPKDLSGGQRQRVALGRAIVREPRLFLMDEPLSNLDAKLRLTMRNEIKELHHKLKATTIYVTHDQVEAMTMADKIVVMNEGFVQQIGSPVELFNQPANLFVAKFIGSPEINIIKGVIYNYQFVSANQDIIINLPKQKQYKAKKVVFLGIRPQDISLNEHVLAANQDAKVKVAIQNMENLGSEMIIYAQTAALQEIAFVHYGRYHYDLNQNLEVAFNKSKLLFFDAETKLNITHQPNDETAQAIKVIANRTLDYQIKKDLLSKENSKKSWTQKIIKGSQQAIQKVREKFTKQVKND